MTAPCQCPIAGWCERHKRNKPTHFHKLCRTREDYRAFWDREAGIVSSFTSAEPSSPDPLTECTLRGEKIGDVTCQLCGQRGKQIPVFACPIEGSCTLRPYKVGDQLPTCIACPYRKPVDLGL